MGALLCKADRDKAFTLTLSRELEESENGLLNKASTFC